MPEQLLGKVLNAAFNGCVRIHPRKEERFQGTMFGQRLQGQHQTFCILRIKRAVDKTRKRVSMAGWLVRVDEMARFERHSFTQVGQFGHHNVTPSPRQQGGKQSDERFVLGVFEAVRNRYGVIFDKISRLKTLHDRI